ncbi:MAG TPA: PD-(D/E)XK nuclease family protein, partial [Dehalococcoidia bacterium]|nr:PD-(D/E)XK nuclease family protein [Dehalococcoidia bacterium]
MPDTSSVLQTIAGARRADPLAPVTVIVPSHVAGLQMRRRLAEITPFAAVRFETLPRIAELLAAGHLAAADRLPLARPIGDYIAEEVARDSRGPLARLADLPGYARALRRMFRRLRRGGIHTSSAVRLSGDRGHLNQILELYDRFRDRTSTFYDDEDLLEEAGSAVRTGKAGALADLGALYVMPPGALSAGGADLLAALTKRSPGCVRVEEAEGRPEARFVLAPDPSSEIREVVREVLSALDDGVSIHEIAVFHGADPAYRKLLQDAFRPAGVPTFQLPGLPLSETPAGRGVLTMLSLPDTDYRRTALLDFLSIAPLKPWLPAEEAPVRARTTVWDRISRDAGVTRGAAVWRKRLAAKLVDLDAEISEAGRLGRDDRVAGKAFERGAAADLLSVLETLVRRLDGLREPLPASEFIPRVKEIIADYFDPRADALEEGPGGSSVIKEIDQLGTVESVDGRFDLSAFAFALGANLEAAFSRMTALGEGVLVGDYRLAAGLQFRRVILCGAFEGALPAGPGGDAIISDRVWSRLRENHPFIEDARERRARAQDAARRAVSAAADTVTWSCPLYEQSGTREYYPSPMMVEAFAVGAGTAVTATELRGAPALAGRLHRTRSPLAGMLRGLTADAAEQQLRQAVIWKRDGTPLTSAHPSWRAVSLLTHRRSRGFSGWDGNLAGFPHPAWLELQGSVSPTSLENYAACGFRYLCRSLLRLSFVEEPDERELMDPAARGTLIHRVLERFFREARAAGRPAVGERWSDGDRQRLVSIAEEEMEAARQRGISGLEAYSRHELRTMRADIERFLEEDDAFRAETGAVPASFEESIPETLVAGVRLRGRVDRVDITPDGSSAWVVDYKTGSSWEFRYGRDDDPLLGGKKLQLPTYL